MATTQPTAAQTQQQIDAIKQQLGSVGTSLQATAPNMAQFLVDTKQTQQADATAPRYTDAYNTVFDNVKNIKLDVGSAQLPGGKSAQAFYVFNPNDYAQKQANSQIDAANAQHAAYTDQQAAFQKYVQSKNNEASNQAFDMYFNDVLKNKYSDLQKGYIANDNPFFNLSAYNKTAAANRFNRRVVAGTTNQYITQYGYKDQAAADKQIASMKAMYMDLFNQDKNLQTTWGTNYKNSLINQQNQLQAQLKKLTK